MYKVIILRNFFILESMVIFHKKVNCMGILLLI